MLLPTDQRLFVMLMTGGLAVAVAVYAILRATGHDPARALTSREWLVVSKLIGIAILALLLYQTVIAFDFPAESFIYGRF
jgi:multisubunit Na+/H+ antiporter MnhB subunit